MKDTATLTIRIDPKIKHQLEVAAAANTRSITEFVVRAVKARITPQCPTCGRSDLPNTLSAGFTPDFAAFLEKVKTESSGYIPIVLATIEVGERRVYRGKLRPDEDHGGAVALWIDGSVRNGSEVTMRIPRGSIVGWCFDQTGDRLRSFLSQGYSDGTNMVRMLMVAAATADGRVR